MRPLPLAALCTLPCLPGLHIPLLPVLHDLEPHMCAHIAELLTQAELNVCSVSLRHPSAAASLAKLVAANPLLTVGASTVVAETQLHHARSAGAAFVSTVFTAPKLLHTSSLLGLPILAGYSLAHHDVDVRLTACRVSTYEEALAALDGGATALKFYPASSVSPEQLSVILDALNRAPCAVLVAGAVKAVDFSAYVAAGAHGFALGVNCRGLDPSELGTAVDRLSSAHASIKRLLLRSEVH